MKILHRIFAITATCLLLTGIATDTLAWNNSRTSAKISALPVQIKTVQSSTLSWISTNVKSCTGVNFWTGGLTSGTVIVAPSETTTYSITCTGKAESANASVTVQVGSSSMSFYDDFSSYVANVCMPDGTVFGPWVTAYAGYGCIKTIVDATGQIWLNEAPQASTKPLETHAALSLGPRFSVPFKYSIRLNTIKQLRTGSAPNPWEVGWILWNYTDDKHFYYIALKPNGWELGKEDPAYPGAQRFLADGSSPKFPIGNDYDISITQMSDDTMSVSVNGQELITFTDTERPYSYGHIGLYTEDASVNFNNVSVTVQSSNVEAAP